MAKKSKDQNHLHSWILVVSGLLLGIVVTFYSISTASSKSDQAEGKGFDELGYNRSARIFQGPSDGVDGLLDGTTYGDATYGKDLLKMKWNAEWDRGNAEGWTNGPYGAWIDNNWNGQVAGGSGEVWQYRIKWIDTCGATGAPTADGGYCIWGQFEVVMSQGTIANEHFWDAHAIPAGFGSN